MPFLLTLCLPRRYYTVAQCSCKVERMVRRFLLSTQKTILSAAFVISATYGVSAILGLLRSRLLATYFGVSEDLTVFYTADKIPSFIYSLIAVGTISTIFIPVFTDFYKKNKKKAWHTAVSMINISVLAFAFLAGTVYAFSPQIIRLLSVGRFTLEQVQLGTNLMRLMMLSQLVLVLSSFITSLLQSFKYFVLPALAPLVYNVGMIAGIVFLTPRHGIYGPAIGVLIGAFLHLLIQLPLLPKIKLPYKFGFDLKDQGVREIFSLMPPRLLSSALLQISPIINNALAIVVATSAAVVFKFADQLQSFPVHLFGASMALAALPTLSGVGNKEKFRKTFLTTFHQMMFFVMPASVILLVLRVPVVRLVFGAQNFPWEATLDTALTLGFFSLSIFSQSGMYLLTRAFYALKDTLTPVKVSLVTVIASSSLAYYFVAYLGLGVWSLALAYSLGSILDLSLLLIFLSSRVGGFNWRTVLVPFTKIGMASALMGVALYLPMKFLDFSVFDTSRVIPLLLLTGTAALAGSAVYLALTWAFNVEEIELFYKLVRKLRPRASQQDIAVAAPETQHSNYTP